MGKILTKRSKLFAMAIIFGGFFSALGLLLPDVMSNLNTLEVIEDPHAISGRCFHSRQRIRRGRRMENLYMENNIKI